MFGGALLSLAAVYANDRACAEICTRMQIAGFGFDPQRATLLADALHDREADAFAKARKAVGRDVKLFSPKDMHAVIRGHFGAPIYFRSALTGNPVYDKSAMRAYAASANPELASLAVAVLEARSARKLRGTYIEGVKVNPTTRRVHPSWQNYGTVSGRWACSKPNLMNLPRPASDPTSHLGGIRSLYVAGPGRVLVTFDFAQLEMRVAAYVSGDSAMIAACETSDLHATNAALIFGDRFDLRAYEAAKATASPDAAVKARLGAWKHLRTMAKSSGFAVCYMAEADTVFSRLVADGVSVTLAQCEAMLRKLHRVFHGYFEWQAAQLLEIIRTGYVYTPILGRRRWLGHSPGAPEAANPPIQGGAADIVNDCTVKVDRKLRSASRHARILGQVHDSIVIEAPKGDAASVSALCRDVCQAPRMVCGRQVIFPIDLEVTERWQ